MPQKPLRPCGHPGCRKLSRDKYCAEHSKARQPDMRPSASARGYNYKWQKRRAMFLAEHPWCAHCRARGVQELASDVDHIIPHKGDLELFWGEDNWQGLCASCHSTKTAREDGGFGNPHS